MKVEEICPEQFIDILSKSLKEEKKIEKPVEADHIKTGHGRELAPVSEDWYHVRAASLLRKLYMEELTNPEKSKYGFGVMWFARAYGGAKNNGHKPSHTVSGSKSLVRRILQSLETVKLVSKVSLGGRKLTQTGHAYLQEIAGKASSA
ncbi:small subunit ribosomal protein S19e [Nematocida parisii]|uniref:30S ribosomal protein S19e n=1 Tax=Nematocida parisii (strain ERTm3) TaxID=935791 RepID=I3EKP5_NEMP3|nr:30S ribosomal protein S19e [Nematocida parisii ERTm1]EIJ89792.1 30S ribosomal protein S19e [Nematocida parisii ERTm3]KAI5128543.1 small subunit ribosomal protein S19e [Nematocida parisii]KAI5166046.1 small subunit ribosomal protein S19e [Nematocida sp. AWRm79]KAI5183085.1 small subunit ribosomal protein S19e [Nematocida sp. AWRm78]OAG32537.1 small subunit ribosomal protein S19e [Nematocida sp. ERTm5]|eukprot:XP_013058501.1 30S ribosomal protein S19e [Nematocida parisii ERTm1]